MVKWYLSKRRRGRRRWFNFAHCCPSQTSSSPSHTNNAKIENFSQPSTVTSTTFRQKYQNLRSKTHIHQYPLEIVYKRPSPNDGSRRERYRLLGERFRFLPSQHQFEGYLEGPANPHIHQKNTRAVSALVGDSSLLGLE